MGLASLRYPKWREFVTQWGEIGLVWGVIGLNVFSFFYLPNEVDIVPFAKQFVEPNWLANDWYLNLDFGYRYLFNWFLGLLVSWFGLEVATVLGRLGLYLALAVALHFLFKTLVMRLPYRLLVLILFLHNQSLLAGEWIVGGVETKTVSYVCLLFSFSFFLRRRYWLGFALAGAAVSFHVLIGCYALFCLGVAILLNKEWRADWRLMLGQCWSFFLTASWGLFVAVDALSRPESSPVAWEIYVLFRNPHHLFPPAWPGYPWRLILLGGAIVFVCLVYWLAPAGIIRFLAAYLLGATLLFLFGWSLYLTGHTTLLRYYWFRLPDTMFPLLNRTLIGLFLNQLNDGQFAIPIMPSNLQNKAQTLLRYSWPPLFALILIFNLSQSLTRLSQEFERNRQLESDPLRVTLRWIAENSPLEAIFLADPSLPDFYLLAQRATFVSWKHTPHLGSDILEWYKRICLTNGRCPPNGNGFAVLPELKANFYSLNPAQISSMAHEYGLTYYLGKADHPLPFKPVYNNGVFIVYDIRTTK